MFLKTIFAPEPKILLIKRTTKLKEMYIVRYADDFKIFTTSHKNAIKIFHAVNGYLKNHLFLDISPDKSTITNLRKRSSDFLGFKIKAVKKRKTYVAHTNLMDKKINSILEKARHLIKEIQKSPSSKRAINYNTFILGIKNYYKVATHVNLDFALIAYRLSRTLHNRLKSIGKYGIPLKPSETYKKFHKNRFKTYEIEGIHLFPIADIKTKNNFQFNQNICDYTKEGRQHLHKYLKNDIAIEINKMYKKTHPTNSVEYIDNRISRYSMQLGKCAVTGQFLTAEEVHCHHKTPRQMGGTDEFKNLIIVHEIVHKLIHATENATIEKYKNMLQLDGKQLKKLNQLRKSCNLVALV